MNKFKLIRREWILFYMLAACSSTPPPARVQKDLLTERAKQLQEELSVGREVAAKLMGTYGDLNERKKTTEYLNLIMQSLAQKAGRPEIIYRVGILDTEQVNAFAAPGGYILITRGLLETIENEHELAGVLAHEMGHINQRHLYKEIAPKREISTGETLSRLLSRGGANVSFALGQAVTKGVKTLVDEGLKPELEYQADQSGVEYSWATGYDPRHYRILLARLAQSEKFKSTNLQKTHPPFTERLKKIDAHLLGLGVRDPAPTATSSVMLQRFAIISTKK